MDGNCCQKTTTLIMQWNMQRNQPITPLPSLHNDITCFSFRVRFLFLGIFVSAHDDTMCASGIVPLLPNKVRHKVALITIPCNLSSHHFPRLIPCSQVWHIAPPPITLILNTRRISTWGTYQVNFHETQKYKHLMQIVRNHRYVNNLENITKSTKQL